MTENSLTIMQIAPIFLPIGEDMKYAGTERVIMYLDQAFTRLGHRSIVAAPRDSQVSGILYPTISQSIWKANNERREMRDSDELTQIHYDMCVDLMLKNGIDVVHDHPGNSITSSEAYKRNGSKIKTPILITLHGAYFEGGNKRYDSWKNLVNQGRQIYFTTISDSQGREFEKRAGIESEVIHHGVPLDLFEFQEKPTDYLFSFGRISPEKGQHLAIKVAKKIGMPLVLAGEVHSHERKYWEELVEPHIDGEQIQFVGPLDDRQKAEWYRNASAFLMPIQWDEPFGLVMIESMACGTPVIAYSRGSVPEIVKDGETGFLVERDDLEAMVQSVKNISQIDRKNCRKHVEENFRIERQAQNYVNLYRRISA